MSLGHAQAGIAPSVSGDASADRPPAVIMFAGRHLLLLRVVVVDHCVVTVDHVQVRNEGLFKTLSRLLKNGAILALQFLRLMDMIVKRFIGFSKQFRIKTINLAWLFAILLKEKV